jgi:hypothetical protein
MKANPRHSGMLLAGIQKSCLDTGFRQYGELGEDTYFW